MSWPTLLRWRDYIITDLDFEIIFVVFIYFVNFSIDEANKN